jgi:ATP-dependent DNA helicase RecQ
MGFDKPDVGCVIHFQRLPSVIHYYQQVGRAGPAIEEAYGVLLSGDEDDEIADYFMRTAFPSEEEVDPVLMAVRAANRGSSAPASRNHSISQPAARKPSKPDRRPESSRPSRPSVTDPSLAPSRK